VQYVIKFSCTFYKTKKEFGPPIVTKQKIIDYYNNLSYLNHRPIEKYINNRKCKIDAKSSCDL